MIKVNLLNDHSVAAPKKQKSQKNQHAVETPQISRIGFAYIAAIIAAAAVLGYMWISSGNAIKAASSENQRLERDLKEMEDLRRQFVELEQKKQERQGRIDTIEKLLDSQKGPVKLMNAVIQAVPQNRNIWLTSLEQAGNGVKVKGETRIPEALPDFMDALKKSGIFAGVDIEIIERHDEISNFSILCANK